MSGKGDSLKVGKCFEFVSMCEVQEKEKCRQNEFIAYEVEKLIRKFVIFYLELNIHIAFS